MSNLETPKAAIRRVLPAPLYRLYRRQRHRWVVGHYQPRTVVQRYGDADLTIRLEDPLAEGWYAEGFPVPQEVDALRPWLKPGATVFDLGAHQAVVALVLAHAVGPTGRVIAVEPDIHNVRVGRRNCELNPDLNVEIVHAAVGEEPGETWFTDSLNGKVDPHGARVGNQRVEVVSIDQLADRYGQPDVVLVDVEGYEVHALHGAQRTLESAATMMVEVHDEQLPEFGKSVADVVSALGDRQLSAAPDRGDFAPLNGSTYRYLLASR